MFAEDISEDFSEDRRYHFYCILYRISGYLRNLRGRLLSSENFSEVLPSGFLPLSRSTSWYARASVVIVLARQDRRCTSRQRWRSILKSFGRWCKTRRPMSTCAAWKAWSEAWKSASGPLPRRMASCGQTSPRRWRRPTDITWRCTKTDMRVYATYVKSGRKWKTQRKINNSLKTVSGKTTRSITLSVEFFPVFTLFWRIVSRNGPAPIFFFIFSFSASWVSKNQEGATINLSRSYDKRNFRQ